MKNKRLIIACVLVVICRFGIFVRGESLTTEGALYVEETAREMVAEVRRYGALNSALTVDYVTEDIHAEAGRDYVAQRGTLHFGPGEETTPIRISILDDGLVEHTETFRIKLSDPSTGLNPAANQVLVSIIDNEAGGNIDQDFRPHLNSTAFGEPVVQMPDGKVVLTIYRSDQDTLHLVRLNVNGTIDETFHPVTVKGEQISWAALHGIDKLLVLKCSPVPAADGCASLIRLHSDGTVDSSFSPPAELGLVLQPSPVVLPDGKILVGTSGTPGGLARLNSNGSLDTAFQAPSKGNTTVGLLMLSDQSIVLNTLKTAPDGVTISELQRLKPDGSLDPSFKAPFEFVWIRQLSAELDGKFYVSARILHAGEERQAFVRLNLDGSLDPSFSLTEDPLISTNPFLVIGLEPSGRIIGRSSREIIRLNHDGTWDRSYLIGNICIRGRWTGGADMGAPLALLLPDGQMLFWEYGRLLRLDPAKTDRTGFRITAANCPACCQSDFEVSESAGQTLIGIQRLGDSTGSAVVRFATRPLTASGNIDYASVDTFVTFGPLETTKHVAVQIVSDYEAELEERLELLLTRGDGHIYNPDGRAIVGIWDDDRIGSRDSHYQAPSGYQLIGMQWDGKLLGGRTGTAEATIRRFDLDGQLDPTWPGPDLSGLGFVSRFLGLQTDGKVYLASLKPGIADSFFRLNSDGTIDSSFQPKLQAFPVSGTVIRQGVQGVLAQPDGTILVAVESERVPTGLGSVFHIVRLKPDGAIDPAFFRVKVNAFNLMLFPGTAGKIWLTGFLVSVNDVSKRAIVRLNQDGTVDESFSLLLGATNVSDAVYSHLKLADGTYLFGGRFQFTNETRQRFLIHLSADGEFDPAFAPQVNGNFPYIGGLAQQSDGKIVLAGAFDSINGISRTGLGRLNLDGSLDTTFDAGQQAALFEPERIFLQPDGQIIAEHSGFDPSWQRFNGDKRAALIAQPSDGGRLQAQVISYSAQRVVIEATQHLPSPDWRPIATNSATASHSFRFTDPEQSQFPRRFYRAVPR